MINTTLWNLVFLHFLLRTFSWFQPNIIECFKIGKKSIRVFCIRIMFWGLRGLNETYVSCNIYGVI